MNKNALIGIALVVVVVGVALLIANKPKTQVAMVTDTPLTTSEPTTAPVVTSSPTTQAQPTVDNSTNADIFTAANEVYGVSQFPLSNIGKAHVADFLNKVGLPELLVLKPFGGKQELTKTLCEKLFTLHAAKYPASKSDISRCSENLAKNKNTYEVYGVPIYTNIKELDGKYLLLLVDEEGLGAPSLFDYTYNIQTGRVSRIDHSKESTSLFYLNGKLYFSQGFEEPQHVVATYDLAAQKMVQE